MIEIAICDDEVETLRQMQQVLESMLGERKIDAQIDCFEDGSQLVGAVANGKKYDIIFLDIEMNEVSGMEAAHSIREKDDNVLLIFVSAYEKYMMELFRLDVLGFVQKPIRQERVESVFLEAYQRIQRMNYYFVFHYKGVESKIPCKEILYFESKGRQIRIHLKNGLEEVFNDKLTNVQSRLAEGKIPFLRIHQSYLVNYHLIAKRNKSSVTLFNGKTLPISEDRQKEFDRCYSILIGGEISV